MKKIVKNIPAKVSISYQCKTCKTKYRTVTAAKKCEARILEKREFKVGDAVYPIQKRHCQVVSQAYRPKGKIIKIFGPMLPDYEYETKWLGGKTERLNGHIFQYEVKHICPCHNEKYTCLYFTPEIKRTEKECLEAIKKARIEYRKIQRRLAT